MDKEIIIDELIEWIKVNLDQNLKIRDIARKSGYSPWHLQRMFKDQTGITMGDFVTKLKLETALNMLINTTETIGEIAYITGFSSQQGFTRRFCQVYGETPTQARRNAYQKK